jgi:hypothetical protein
VAYFLGVYYVAYIFMDLRSGVTIAELGADFLSPDGLLKRIFCVLELFATLKGKGRLLLCGPALGDAVKAVELAELAADCERCADVIDSRTARSRAPKAEAAIKKYITGTSGFNRMDKVVLAEIVSACVQNAESALVSTKDGGASVLYNVGCMLCETSEYQRAVAAA